MKTIVVFLLLFTFSQVLSAQSVSTETLTVTVLDIYTENPVGNAEVKLLIEGQLIETGVTDALGIVQFTVEISATGIDPILSQRKVLLPAYPNPFIGTTSIPFALDSHSQITATVHDILGRQVVFLQEDLRAGSQEVQVDLSGFASGMYFLRLLDDDIVLGTSILVNTGAGRNQTQARISFRSAVQNPLSKPILAAKSLSLYSIDYGLEVSKDGYEKGFYSLSMPEEKDFTAWLLVGDINTIGMEFIRIPAGTFEMGDIAGVDLTGYGARPVHTVTLTRDFYLGKYEVKQGEYEAVVGSNPSYFRGDDHLPVEYLTWFDMVRFANALSLLEGYAPCYDKDGNVVGGGVNPYACEGYRLPMEAEWEYAARAGTTTKYSFGDEESELDDYAWYVNNSESRTHVVGEKLPNPWGLYDVHGNLWERVYDWYDKNYYTISPLVDPPGPSSGSTRLFRGGSWMDRPYILRVALRGGSTGPSSGIRWGGFRLARTAH